MRIYKDQISGIDPRYGSIKIYVYNWLKHAWYGIGDWPYKALRTHKSPSAINPTSPVRLESAGGALKNRLIADSAQVFLLTSTVFYTILLSVTVVVLVTQRSAPIPYARILIIFSSRFFTYLRPGLTDLDKINVYTHGLGHASSIGTLIIELSQL